MLFPKRLELLFANFTRVFNIEEALEEELVELVVLRVGYETQERIFKLLVVESSCQSVLVNRVDKVEDKGVLLVVVAVLELGY